MTEPTYSISELAEATGVAARTIRLWIARNLLEPPPLRGAKTRYAESHKVRVLAIRRLRATGLQHDDIRERLAAEERAAAERKAEAERTATSDIVRLPPVPDYPAATWERVTLGPGLELHVHPASGALTRRVAQAIYDWFGPGGKAQAPPPPSIG